MKKKLEDLETFLYAYCMTKEEIKILGSQKIFCKIEFSIIVILPYPPVSVLLSNVFLALLGPDPIATFSIQFPVSLKDIINTDALSASCRADFVMKYASYGKWFEITG